MTLLPGQLLPSEFLPGGGEYEDASGGVGFSWFIVELTSEHVPVTLVHKKLKVFVDERPVVIEVGEDPYKIQVVVAGIHPGVSVDEILLRHSAKINELVYHSVQTKETFVYRAVTVPNPAYISVMADEKPYTVVVDERPFKVQVTEVQSLRVGVSDSQNIKVEVEDD